MGILTKRWNGASKRTDSRCCEAPPKGGIQVGSRGLSKVASCAPRSTPRSPQSSPKSTPRAPPQSKTSKANSKRECLSGFQDGFLSEFPKLGSKSGFTMRRFLGLFFPICGRNEQLGAALPLAKYGECGKIAGDSVHLVSKRGYHAGNSGSIDRGIGGSNDG